MTRWSRMLAALAMATTLTFAVAPVPVFAQEPAPAEGEGESKGRPVDGYIATSVLAFLALFIIGKSARR
jgi:hypothetical protein